MSSSQLVFASFLAPNLLPTYQRIAHFIGSHIGIPTTFVSNQELRGFADGSIDVGFICGLTYVELASQPSNPVQLIAAPTLRGKRYGGKTIYFSDVVVHANSPLTSFEDLAGSRWAYNEPASHSGYNAMLYTLWQNNLSSTHYFAKSIETGAHLNSIQYVLEGKADCAAIDSHLLDALLLKNPELGTQIRIVCSLGPSTIPPVVTTSRMQPWLRKRIQEAFLSAHLDPTVRPYLYDGFIEKFLVVSDNHYDDIRMMYAHAHTAPAII